MPDRRTPCRVRDIGALGSRARGVVGPSGAAAAVSDLIEGLGQGEFLKELVAPMSGAVTSGVVADCMDGRPLVPGGAGPSAPRAAGATLAVLFGLWALGRDLAPGDLARRLTAQGLPVWVHHDCGANAGLDQMLAVLADPAVDEVRARLGVGLAPGLRGPWLDRLAARATATGEAARLAAFAAAGATLGVPVGVHQAVAAIINGIPGTTLDRRRLAEALATQAFVVDAWALPGTAAAVLAALDCDPALRSPLADILLDLSLAAVCVLGGPSLRLIALDAVAPPMRKELP